MEESEEVVPRQGAGGTLAARIYLLGVCLLVAIVSATSLSLLGSWTLSFQTVDDPKPYGAGWTEVNKIVDATELSHEQDHPDNLYAGGSVLILTQPEGGVRCSGGIPWLTRDGKHALVTAGHCGGIGSSLLGEDWSKVGDVTATSGGDTWDASLIVMREVDDEPSNSEQATVLPTIADTTSLGSALIVGSGALPIVGYTDIQEGQSLCYRGTTTGGSCHWRVNSLGRVVEQTDGSAPVYLATVRNFSSTCPSKGDSGGVVYEPAGNGVLVAGVLDASSGMGDKANIFRPCEMAFTPVSALMELFGGRPLTVKDLNVQTP